MRQFGFRNTCQFSPAELATIWQERRWLHSIMWDVKFEEESYAIRNFVSGTIVERSWSNPALKFDSIRTTCDAEVL